MTLLSDRLRALPAVDSLLNADTGRRLVAEFGHAATREALRAVLEASRAALRAGQAAPTDADALLDAAAAHLQAQFRPSLRPVINATGVIIHTNLGRAPLSVAAQQAMQEVAAQYNTLEYDLEAGQRGSRYTHAEDLLCQLTGAAAALVVNNNAAALVLILSALAHGRGVVISRGQLIEIGGGFRIPEIMAQSGARLIEVGTTNRTRLTDFAAAIDEETGLLLRVHSSNFKQIGFVEQPELAELGALAQERGLPLVDDLGSGALLDTARYGLAPEPTVQASIDAGAALVAFSGDKLLGGPQAGIIVGRADLVQRLKRHPLARALRVDKLTYAALQATLEHYRRDEALTQLPIWRMIARPLAEIEAEARQWAAALGGEVIFGESTVGGGSLPGATLPTALVALDAASPDRLLTALRRSDPPIIARITADRVCLDPRTILPAQVEALLAGVRRTLHTLKEQPNGTGG